MNPISYQQTHTIDTAGQPVSGPFSTLSTWLQRSRTRRQLSELPAYLLKDIGLNESDRYQEVSKPFWQQ
ncbi:hypothetical protein C7H85_02710 [Zobellella endophytica]|uniref:YjiS-like domain-containing protein n=1 Tax=Zobellella endophytica TaxID=2116700 RepID=A0A2P7RC47_9GAMM|nr:hypothetical protein C7H85_02710 [Zobellella endophytica]